MEIINNQRDAATSIGELRQHPVDHRRCIEVRCRCRRFRAAVCTGGVTDRVEQGKPELLGVLLVALHLQHGEPARLPRTVGPGAQQRRLPAAGRSRDDRHLPRRRAIQGSDKITPVDQPGSCWSHRQRPALISTPDTPGAGHAVLAPSVSVPGQRACCQPRANPRFCCQPRESPGSGDDLLPAWRQAWDVPKLAQPPGACSETPGRYRDITSLRRRQRPRSAHPAVGTGPAIRDRACCLTRSTAAGGSRRPGLALLVIATTQLMVVLDATIVNVVLPHVQ